MGSRNLERIKQSTFQVFDSSLRSSRLYFVISFSIQCVSQLSRPVSSEIPYALEIVYGSFLFWGIRKFLLNSLTFSSVICCKRLSGLQPNLFQFSGRHDALKAPFSAAVLHFKLAARCYVHANPSLFLSVIAKQNWMLTDWLGNLGFFFRDNYSFSEIKYLK